MEAKIIEKENQYGVLLDGIEVVPAIHDDKQCAIDEFEYFETLNSSLSKPFLNHVLSFDEIEIIKKELIK